MDMKQDGDERAVSGLELAVIGRKHFGNPIPKAWYAAARELIAALASKAAATADGSTPPAEAQPSNSMTDEQMVTLWRRLMLETAKNIVDRMRGEGKKTEEILPILFGRALLAAAQPQKEEP